MGNFRKSKKRKNRIFRSKIHSRFYSFSVDLSLECQLDNAVHFCLSPKEFSVFSIDPAFDRFNGNISVNVTTYRNLKLENLSSREAPVFLGPLLMHQKTSDHQYSLDPSIINSNSLEVFKSKLLAFIRPVPRSICNVFNPQGLKFLTRLRLGLSPLNEHRFRYNFKDCINALCPCSLEVENTLHFFFALPSLFNFSHGSYE